MKENYLINVKAEKAPGVLARLLVILSRRRIEMQSVMMCDTDIRSIVLISGEIMIDPAEIGNLLLQFEKVIEVLSTYAQPLSQTTGHRLAYFKMAVAFLESPQAAYLSKFGAQILKLTPESLTICKSGTGAVITEFYNLLEGKHLLGFTQTGMIADSPLVDNDEWRISRLAA